MDWGGIVCILIIAGVLCWMYLIGQGWTEKEKVIGAVEYADYLNKIYPGTGTHEAALMRRRHLLSRGRFSNPERDEAEFMRIGWILEGYHLRDKSNTL
jgi:hypothetical protein